MLTGTVHTSTFLKFLCAYIIPAAASREEIRARLYDVKSSPPVLPEIFIAVTNAYRAWVRMFYDAARLRLGSKDLPNS